MNADEIVKALRWEAKETDFKFAAETMNEAADLIESLQAQLAEYKAVISQTADRIAALDVRTCEIGNKGCPVGHLGLAGAGSGEIWDQSLAELEMIRAVAKRVQEKVEYLQAQLANKTALIEATIAGQETLQKALNRRGQPENEPLVRCGECEKYQSPNCAAKHEQALRDFCSHGERKPERGEE